MKADNIKILKVLGLISASGTLCFAVYFFMTLFKIESESHSILYFLKNLNLVTYPLITLISLFILLKATTNKGIILFSLFLIFISLNILLSRYSVLVPEFDNFTIATLSFLFTSIAYISSLQNFPQQISTKDINLIFKRNKFIRNYLKFALKDQYWLIFTLILFVFAALMPGNISMQATSLMLVLTTGLLFLYVNYKISSPSSRNKIIWLVWGILVYSFLSLLTTIMIYSDSVISPNLMILINALRALSFFVSVTMCLFFFNTFDTGILIRRTIVDGLIFLFIVFLYNTIEHYFLHWMTHELHISNTLISSILSGFFVLIFSPVHHRFMGLLKKKISVEDKKHS